MTDPANPAAGTIPLDFVPGTADELARCLTDPMWRVCSGQLYKIMVKGAGEGETSVVPFRPNRAQRRLLARLPASRRNDRYAPDTVNTTAGAHRPRCKAANRRRRGRV